MVLEGDLGRDIFNIFGIVLICEESIVWIVEECVSAAGAVGFFLTAYD